MYFPAYKTAVTIDDEDSGRALRRTKTNVLTGLLPEPAKKTRKPLTPEEMEQRNKKVSMKVRKYMMLGRSSFYDKELGANKVKYTHFNPHFCAHPTKAAVSIFD